ncbi:MAG: MFS transporter [Planctomycetota bacterium]
MALRLSGMPVRDSEGFARTAWILLDWAASAFSTVLITLVVAYVERAVFVDRVWGVSAGVVWAWTLAAAMLVSAVLAPWVAAWADRTRGHKQALLTSVAAGAGGLLLLALVPSTARLAVAASITAAAVGFDMAAIFTGSLLARIAGGRDADRLSAWGFAAGYAGGAIALIAATAVVAAHDRLGLTASEGLRVAFALTAAWWLVFSLPAAFARFGDGERERHAATSGGELLAFARSLARPTPDDDASQNLGGILLGAVLVLGAVQTAIAQFSSVALEQFNLDGPALVRLVLLVQAVALPGALAIGWLSSRYGRAWGLAISLAGWVTVLVLACFIRTPTQLHALAVLLAIVLGGVQSVIRATIATLAPQGRAGVTFGLMQVGTKLTGFVASLAFGSVQALTNDPRTGLTALLLQLLAGWWLLRRLR